MAVTCVGENKRWIVRHNSTRIIIHNYRYHRLDNVIELVFLLYHVGFKSYRVTSLPSDKSQLFSSIFDWAGHSFKEWHPFIRNGPAKPFLRIAIEKSPCDFPMPVGTGGYFYHVCLITLHA